MRSISVITRNFRFDPRIGVANTKVFNFFGNPLLESCPLMSVVQNLREDRSMVDVLTTWIPVAKTIPGMEIVSHFNWNSPRKSYYFLPGESYNVETAASVETTLRQVCQILGGSIDMVFTLALIYLITTMVKQEIFGTDQRGGLWEILIIAETPSEATTTHQFQAAAIQIHRHRELYLDRTIHRKNVQIKQVVIDRASYEI